MSCQKLSNREWLLCVVCVNLARQTPSQPTCLAHLSSQIFTNLEGIITLNAWERRTSLQFDLLQQIHDVILNIFC